MVLNCFKCKAEVVFDSEHIGKNGKKIPLDPETHTPHKCPVDQQEKNDHGNEDSTPLKFVDHSQHYTTFVDHTQKGQSKVKIFYAAGTDILEEQYNAFLKINNGQIRTQERKFQIRDSGFAIALWYEEVKT